MGVRLTKPWFELEGGAALERLPGQLGVFEFADRSGAVVFIGCADARTRFGLRSAAIEARSNCPTAVACRFEVTSAYTTRYLELLMAYRADHGVLPMHNADVPSLGRLTPG